MGYNFAGIAIDQNFNKDPMALSGFLGLPMVLDSEVDFESASARSEEGFVHVFFSDCGTLVFHAEEFQLDKAASDGHTVFSFMVSETAMAFYFCLDRNRKRVREFMVHDDAYAMDKGRELAIEENEHNMSEIIFSQIGELYGTGFYDIPLETTGLRFKLTHENNGEATAKTTTAYSKLGEAPAPDRSWEPAGIKLNLFHWMSRNKGILMIQVGFIALFAFLSFTVHGAFAVILGIVLVFTVLFYLTVTKHYRTGEILPGKVIQVNPGLVAAASDLSKGQGYYPVLRISRTRLSGDDAVLGKHVPILAMYSGDHKQDPCYRGFLLSMLSHGTRDTHLLKKWQDSFTPEDLSRIDAFLEKAGTERFGTYRIPAENSDWTEHGSMV